MPKRRQSADPEISDISGDTECYGHTHGGIAEGWWYTVDPVGEPAFQSASSYCGRKSCGGNWWQIRRMSSGGNFGDAYCLSA